ncbi:MULTISPECIES: AAC(3) family N-acetyltransferase [unclassified Treponema]|uniref:AAC(3) family N-acetyltransferase n=1 Tax=unclassified Treponema TaxID=2638727 RepID=UPI0020A2A896|nr:MULTISPECIES: AAC(3) family N-acetyltransferase [unclassified Treponema]UTC68220.1 AAC(3) family N-acetyltransferase [Treponema sp. OMZ 789]UTC70940.1 AAC(3) family N-acetyltransferase [Treponema sp. OMZ 790]UTC73680.1 AAC(3) family N-acetyltransferase [Treponema sp. OMZ 791]
MSLMNDFINQLPIFNGDIVLFTSDAVRLGYYFHKNKENFDINELLDLILNKIGTAGTVLFPTYNWDFCKGIQFDYKNTPSQTGSLSQAALKHSAFKRTKHPIYSWAVAGKDREYLCELNNTDSFAEDSPFAYLYKKNGKNIILDVSMQNSFTFVHYVEQTVGVSYRYVKNFSANYIDETGMESLRTYSMFVRDYDMDAEVNLEPLENYLLDNKIIEETKIACSRILSIPLNKTFDIIKEDILNNQSKMIATYKGQKN